MTSQPPTPAPPVLGIKATVGDGPDRGTVGYLPDHGWWCEHHGTRPCHHRAALRAHLQEHTP